MRCHCYTAEVAHNRDQEYCTLGCVCTSLDTARRRKMWASSGTGKAGWAAPSPSGVVPLYYGATGGAPAKLPLQVLQSHCIQPCCYSLAGISSGISRARFQPLQQPRVHSSPGTGAEAALAQKDGRFRGDASRRRANQLQVQRWRSSADRTCRSRSCSGVPVCCHCHSKCEPGF